MLDLSELSRRAVSDVVKVYANRGASAEKIAVVVRIGGRRGAYQGDLPFYAASVVKLPFALYLRRRYADGVLKETPELDRAERDMIVDSSNDATGLIVDAVTETTGGPELPPDELRAWMDRRAAVDRWLTAEGFVGVRARQKTWNEAPYGREKQGYGPDGGLVNTITPNAAADLLEATFTDRLLAPTFREPLQALLHRTRADDLQRRAFLGGVVGPGVEVWSKAGYTSEVRHDVARLVGPDGRTVVIAVFTKDLSEIEALIPEIGRHILRDLGFPVV